MTPGGAPYVLRIRRGVSGVGPAHRRAKKAPLKRGLSAELTGGFCPRVRRREKNPPGMTFGHASPLFKGGRTGGHTGPPLRHDRTRSDIQKFLIPNS